MIFLSRMTIQQSLQSLLQSRCRDLPDIFVLSLMTQNTDAFHMNSVGFRRIKTFAVSMTLRHSIVIPNDQRCLSRSPKQKFLRHMDKSLTSYLQTRSSRWLWNQHQCQRVSKSLHTCGHLQMNYNHRKIRMDLKVTDGNQHRVLCLPDTSLEPMVKSLVIRLFRVRQRLESHSQNLLMKWHVSWNGVSTISFQTPTQ